MRKIIFLFKKRQDFWVFLFLLIIAFGFIVKSNTIAKSQYLHSSNYLCAKVFNFKKNITQYFGLITQNQILWQENETLRKEILSLKEQKNNFWKNSTSIELTFGNFEVFRAEVLKNSIKYQKNYILINKGQLDSIDQDMGVISSQGIVGIVEKSTSKFSTIQSVLNVLSKLSVALKNSGHYGTLQWNGQELNIVQMVDVPNIAPISIGDTIVTDGRSSIFPKAIPVGKVINFENNTSDKTLIINVKLFTDMSNLQYLYILKNKEQKQIKQLEELLPNE